MTAAATLRWNPIPFQYLGMEKKIEALLFELGKPLALSELQKYLGIDEATLEEAVVKLKKRNGGITLVDDGKTLELRTSGEASSLIERVRKEEYSREVGKAGL